MMLIAMISYDAAMLQYEIKTLGMKCVGHFFFVLFVYNKFHGRRYCGTVVGTAAS